MGESEGIGPDIQKRRVKEGVERERIMRDESNSKTRQKPKSKKRETASKKSRPSPDEMRHCGKEGKRMMMGNEMGMGMGFGEVEGKESRYVAWRTCLQRKSRNSTGQLGVWFSGLGRSLAWLMEAPCEVLQRTAAGRQSTRHARSASRLCPVQRSPTSHSEELQNYRGHMRYLLLVAFTPPC